MEVKITDLQALNAVAPAALSAFVRGAGWQKGAAYGDKADLYFADGRPELLVPRNKRLADYARTVSQLISVLAEFSGGDELSTYRDIIAADHDMIRVRAIGADDDGSIKLDLGVDLVSQARDMLLAAACATKNPQPVYRADAIKEASEYMKRVRLGQTEHGSFVVTMMAPVPPTLRSESGSDWAHYDDEPMERQVTRRLVQSLRASRKAVELSQSGNGDTAFEDARNCGVSANLCEAVSSLIDRTDGLEVSVSWARTRPTPKARDMIEFTNSDAAVLKEAARTFRAQSPRPDVKLLGRVNKLRPEPHEIDGMVTFRAEVDDKIHSVSAYLSQADYAVAVRAHGTRNPVIITGDLERVGQRWKLTNASVRELDASGEDES